MIFRAQHQHLVLLDEPFVRIVSSEITWMSMIILCASSKVKPPKKDSLQSPTSPLTRPLRLSSLLRQQQRVLGRTWSYGLLIKWPNRTNQETAGSPAMIATLQRNVGTKTWCATTTTNMDTWPRFVAVNCPVPPGQQVSKALLGRNWLQSIRLDWHSLGVAYFGHECADGEGSGAGPC